METLKKNWPLFVCTAAVIATMIGCTLALHSTLEGHLGFIGNEASSLVDYARRQDRGY